ncbi:sugar transport family protein [Blastocystis sp. ATCC 50177/Nand II]|uniref:Sugar transport family protein n=1 Tax=Blastocystis sp. subtype 1 (strain ATCC 50177 / NandII) TaxID=478820 RepID=A0A196S8S1_BLAHN|nr:sugar transport family protein [Blastocystis sp. ATCC 50177/Nand II]
MFEPTNELAGFLMTLLAVFGWATLNNAVLSTSSPPGIFHFNLMFWRFIWAFVGALLLGASFMPPTHESMLSNLNDLFSAPKDVIFQKIGATFVAGFTDMLLQIFLLGAVSGAGISNTIPLQIGLATVFGAFLTYIVERRAKLQFLIPGVCFNFLAVIVNTATYSSLSKDQKGESEALLKQDCENPQDGESQADPSTVSTKLSTWELVLICIIGALMATFWGPMTAVAGKDPYSLNPYSIATLTSFFSSLTAFPFSYISMRHPFVGEPATVSDLIHAEWRDIFPAVWGGLCWAIGTYGFCLGASKIGFAIAYVLSQSTPFVSSLYAIFLWKEFRVASKKTWFLESCMLASLAVSVVFLCSASQ